MVRVRWNLQPQPDRVRTQSLFVNPMPTFVEGRTESVENIVVVEASGQANIAAVGSRTEWVG